MKLPWQRARDWWLECGDGQPFETLVGQYIAGGHYVWSSPTEFVLAAEVRLHNGVMAQSVSPNAWFLHLAAAAKGQFHPAAFLRLAPRPHETVCWHRRGRLQVFRWAQFAGRQPAPPMHYGQ